jgi:hypothetical protein
LLLLVGHARLQEASHGCEDVDVRTRSGFGLALRVNRHHPGRAVWTKEHSAAYRLLWELLQDGMDEAAAA